MHMAGADAVAKLTGVRHLQLILEDVNARGDAVEEEVHGRIADAAVVAKAALQS